MKYGVEVWEVWGQSPFVMQAAYSRLFMIRNMFNQR
jgi:hypothetical protein